MSVSKTIRRQSGLSEWSAFSCRYGTRQVQLSIYSCIKEEGFSFCISLQKDLAIFERTRSHYLWSHWYDLQTVSSLSNLLPSMQRWVGWIN